MLLVLQETQGGNAYILQSNKLDAVWSLMINIIPTYISLRQLVKEFQTNWVLSIGFADPTQFLAL